MARNIKSVVYTAIGEHRGKPRIWLEGRKLQRAGIEPGRRFSVVWDRETREVHIDFTADNPNRIVSKRTRNGRELPIIDIGADLLEEAFGSDFERAKVTIDNEKIVIEIHPDDLAAHERLDRMMSRIAAKEPLLTGSLAHGGGILDHAIHTGLSDRGIDARLAFAVEIDAATLDVAATNNPIWDENTIQIQGAMEQVDMNILPEVDILIAGLPCVGASKSGKAKNGNQWTESHPTAGALFVTFLQVVDKTNPAIVILENVLDYAHSASAEVIRATLSNWGYHIHETVLEGAKMGAVEDRHRMCLIAVSPQLQLRLDNLQPTRIKEATLSEILEDISPDSDLWQTYGYLLTKAARDAEKGNNFKLNRVDPTAETIGALGKSYYKVRATEAKINHPTNPDLMRQLTPLEHARAKTIPEELIANVGLTLAHSILGNAVIWAAFQSVGQHLGEVALDHVASDPRYNVMQLEANQLPEFVDELFYEHDEENQYMMFAPA